MEETPHYRNQISNTGKIIGGFLLCFFTLLAITTIIAFWPDRLPSSGKMARYECRLFNITLLDSACISPKGMSMGEAILVSAKKSDSKTASVIPNTAAKKDTLLKVSSADHTGTLQRCITPVGIDHTIQFNTLMLLLVAAAGFLGNMIHIASSFTTFIGANQFKRSWILWYCVKPFTASALALVVYFAFRAGFLNSNDPGNTLNIYGIMTVSALSGLFTDTATQKMKEVFEVIFRPKEARPDSLEDTKPSNG